ncbi:hypothetical protein TVAG_129630 [Trichomonas vaginalis G3]|uniref:Uncharacterized protein n=1 Tax=Trichomonas vaginalis (strain ATCC PRA-98 / G3) TaxID=412133 RepID=A2DI59_TRIV3|nr:Potassium Channel Kv1.1, Chain A domain-containing protein [Trichomonas vaginalis G3]EAY19855.1 hypothetical protein TVAG_129630 [Trichomonas vaginalis G3]KAI5510016.1 Potassium Channel Kv1.1, Chain A domain-containing protein [Trichomonas vaginalis G3]|eukprot:XP_001580841.1 hypothetical protein [Trichomonas vaginalis G3]
MSSSSNKNYSIIYDNKKYRVDPLIFCKMSEKFKTIYEQNPEKYKFENDEIDQEVFVAFISSCQLKTFQINPKKAQALLKLAREWEAPSLESYATTVCRENGYPVYPRVDPIGDLKIKQDRNEDCGEDYKRAGAVFMDSLDDDRLMEFDPEPLFRIVAYAEKLPNFDEQKYADFVMKLRERRMDAAVLLSLRLNFTKITEEDTDALFQSPEMRQQSIGFFVAYSLSQTRHKTQELINETTAKCMDQLHEFGNDMLDANGSLKKALQKDHEKNMKLLNQEIDANADELNRLVREFTRTADILVEGPLSPNGFADPALKRIEDDAQERLNNLYNHIREEIGKNHDEKHPKMRDDVDRVEQDWENEYNDPEATQKRMEDMLNELEGVASKYRGEIDQIDKDLDHIRGSINAKIARDYVRTDKGSRVEANIYSIFDEADFVKEESSAIEDIDARLDKQCPLKIGKK